MKLFTVGETCAEDVCAVVTSRCKVVVMAVGAVQTIVLSCKRTINERLFTVAALETLLMPVQLFVRQILHGNVIRSQLYALFITLLGGIALEVQVILPIPTHF